MPRLKGSKNKPKVESRKFTPPFTGEETQAEPVVAPEPVKPISKVAKQHATYKNNDSQCIPKNSAACSQCPHGPELHYGSNTDWCNHKKCRCQGWVD